MTPRLLASGSRGGCGQDGGNEEAPQRGNLFAGGETVEGLAHPSPAPPRGKLSACREKPPMRDLAVVMPVYNEAECITGVIDAWLKTLFTLGVDALVCVYDDGSTDDSAQRLEVFADDPRVRVTRQPNCGHGPTILRGYREGAAEAEWVFQCDSDGEISPDYFVGLWQLRADLDLGTVIRTGRQQDPGRRAISAVSRALIGLFFGNRVRDVNAPFRLMRSSWLVPLLPLIPSDTFAPNLLIAGAASAGGARVAAIAVQCLPRTTGRSSILGWRALRAALRSAGQTLACQSRLRAAARRSAAPNGGSSRG